MRYTLLLGLGLFCLASCKKIYTCQCNTSFTYLTTSNNYYTTVVPGNKVAYTQKMTESQAKAACAHEEAAVQTDFTNGVTGNGKLRDGESVETDCGLK